MKVYNKRHPRWPHVIFFLLVNVCYCSLAWGMNIGGRVFTDVNDPDGSGLPDVLVSVTNNSATTWGITTDPNGYWIFVALPNDDYILRFSKKGYEFYIYQQPSHDLINPIESITVYDEVTDLAILAVPVSDYGDGTPEFPYLIKSPEDLLKINDELYAHYKLVADIDLDPNLPGGQVFDQAVIAPATKEPSDQNTESVSTAFTGTFDGNSFAIYNFTIIGNSYLGLFGSLAEGAQVTNLHIVDAYVTGNEGKIGSMVGSNSGLITNCSSTGCEIHGSVYVGGLAGINDGSGIVSCSFSSNEVNGEYAAGGLVGANFGEVSNNYSEGLVNGLSDIGGLVGDNLNTVINCYSCSSVDGNYDVGGLTGSNSEQVSGSFWDIETSGQIFSEGGTGLTTVQMHDINTYINTGWDFMGETVNGIDDNWWMPQDSYPKLWWELIPEN